ncbi:MAG TPA: hypothetical protein VFP19_09335 [Candidatus Limnocylindrales bacterium]|nr:hypothetical protein [Candidatus Limnocylindrales bacterium]
MTAPGTRATAADPAARQDAASAGLHYVSDAAPGLRRVRSGRGFSYRSPDGSLIRDPGLRGRIRALAIPPAWTDVWICPSPNGHLQATGRDARGRKQYRYHAAFRAHRDADKYDRVRRFARALPRIREQVESDLAREGLPREKVLAATVRLLERTLIRIGNDDYARENRSFGLSTLRDRHATIDGADIRFRFRGKAGRVHEVELRDRRLASIVRRCRDLPGQELFQYVDRDGTVRDVRSDDVNAYIREAAGTDEFSAKDFRTWAGTVLAFRALAATGRVGPAMRATAERLGNTPAVARSAYVHPAVIDAYLDDDVRTAILRAADVDPDLPRPPAPDEERAVLRLLDRAARASRARQAPRGRRRDARTKPARRRTAASER